MARARNIKPGFFKNEELAELGAEAMLLFAGLWTLADREGRLEDRPRRIRAEVFPYMDVDIDKSLDGLEASGFITRYEANGKSYIAMTSWHKHQNPHHMEVPSEIPPPPGASNKFNHSPITKKQRERIFARDGRKCLICGATESPSIDHITPVSAGGTSDDSNLRTLCETCNYKKGARVDVDSSTGRPRLDDDSSKTVLVPLIPDSGFLIPDSPNRAIAPVVRMTPRLPIVPMSERFEEFWSRHPGKKLRKDMAAGVWAHMVTVENDVALFACLDRYMDSQEVANRAFMNPENWLSECAAGGFTASWPARASPPQQPGLTQWVRD